MTKTANNICKVVLMAGIATLALCGIVGSFNYSTGRKQSVSRPAPIQPAAAEPVQVQQATVTSVALTGEQRYADFYAHHIALVQARAALDATREARRLASNAAAQAELDARLAQTTAKATSASPAEYRAACRAAFIYEVQRYLAEDRMIHECQVLQDLGHLTPLESGQLWCATHPVECQTWGFHFEGQP